MEKPIKEWSLDDWKKKCTHDVLEERTDGWGAWGFFTPRGFVMFVPGVRPERGFETDMLRKRASEPV